MMIATTSTAGSPPRESELNLALTFTAAYQRHQGAHPAWREAMCLETQFPGRLDAIRSDDLIAGRKRPGAIVIFSPQLCRHGGDHCAYCFDPHALQQAEGVDQNTADSLTSFWSREATWHKAQAGMSDDVRQYFETGTPPRVLPVGSGRMGHAGAIRLAGVMLDFDLLLTSGIPGLRKLVEERKDQAEREAGETVLFDAMLVALDVVVKACLHYRSEAEALIEQADDDQRSDLRSMAHTLGAISGRAPQSFREAVQLFWLYSVIADVFNYSRMDVYLGDFYARDIDAGVLSESEAQRLIVALWRLMDESGRPWDTRVFVGGVGRRNEENADRYALAAMEATRSVHRVMPQLTLRFYRGQNPALMERALDVLSEGCQFPSLYNDDVLVPAMASQFDAPLKDAEQYLPLGCGEMTLGHLSAGSPNTAFIVLKALEAALHNGCDGVSGERIGPPSGTLADLPTFDDLMAAFHAQVRFAARLFAKQHRHELSVERQEAAFLHISLLVSDCLSRGKALLDGGCRYRGACVEGFGFTNTGDSLAAIRELVYEKKVLTLDQLVAALDADFTDHDKEHQMMLACPKYGNDIDAVDSLVVNVSSFTCDVIMEEGRKAGLDFLLLSNVNPGGYVMGEVTAASADGRKRGEPFAIGNSPTAGRDKTGPTALLKSASKPDPANGGVTTNIKISRETFTQQRPKVEALMDTYFAIGGMQANMTVVSRGELERALIEPDKHSHLLVRLGGYSAQFVGLEPVIQREIMERTLY